jgi:hypothetical protein
MTPNIGLKRRNLIRVTFVVILLSTLIRSASIPPQSAFDYKVNSLVAGHRFDFFIWETKAIARKLSQGLMRTQWYLNEERRKSLVLEHLSLIRRKEEIKGEINKIYSTSEEPDIASLPLREELFELRSRLARSQDLVEAIIEEQMTSVLNSEGFGASGHVWPPIKFDFERLPLYLVISPRHEIAVRKGLYLKHGLSLDVQVSIEERVDDALDVSSLIVGVGGLSAYPTMVIEIPSLDFIAKTVAHEWVHGYLFFKPLGWHYEESQELRTINETVASIAGDEIGEIFIAMFYPELERSERREEERGREGEGEGFDFNREMRRIRLRVDEMLSEGRVEEAEKYMEEKRRFLVSHGHYIRKLNQAYFAFYGSYATSPQSVDPIGPKLVKLRERCDSLKEFMEIVAYITSYEDLERALGG